MARLNESTTSVESIETLKRRFVRQNRELARVNSMQSLRIRSLESEVSHLLAENVSLREQAIALSQEMERYEAAKLLHDGVYDIKTKLENKLIELNNLVTGLGALPRQFTKSYSEKVDGGIQRDSAQSNWDLKHNEANFEPTFPSEQDWRLPVIPENMDYQKDEPGSYELDVSMESNTSQIAEDSTALTQVKQNDMCLQPSIDFTDNKTTDRDPSITDSFLPPTLETRKRRKYTTAWTDERFDQEPQSIRPHNTPEDTQGPDAQRNLYTEGDTSGSNPPEDDFKFSRPAVGEKCDLDEPCGDPAMVGSLEVKSDSMCDGPPKRKALKPKNANVNLLSNRGRTPTKGKYSPISPSIAGVEDDEDQASKSRIADENIYHVQSVPTQKYGPGDSASHRDERKHKPTTATKPDCTKEELSPSSPLTSLTNEASTELLDPPSRPTRRQRAVVSYAEPNLRDKMRRSNNELIAAVGNGQSRRASNSQDTKIDTCGGTSERAYSRASSKSLDMDAAELVSDEPSTHQMNSVSQRKRKISPSLDYNTVSGRHGASDGSAAASPSAGYERHPGRKSATELQAGTEQYACQPAFETIGDASIELADTLKTAPSAKKQSRRHSSNQRSHSQEPSLQQNMAVSGKKSPDGLSPSFLARRSPSNDPAMDEISGPPETKTPLSDNMHNQSAASLESGPSQTRRAQRVSARRRSMML